MLLAQNLQEIPANFTGITPQNATQGFPITFMDKTFAVWIAENCRDFDFTGILWGYPTLNVGKSCKKIIFVDISVKFVGISCKF